MSSPPVILVVDDDAALREGLSDILEAAGYAVCAEGRGDAALAALRRRPAALALVDYHLPDGLGFEWAGRLRAQCPGLRIMLLTGMAEGDLPTLPKDSGVCRILTKPIDPRMLIELIEKTVHS